MATGEFPSPLDAAREMAPTIRSCADRIEMERELPGPLFVALAGAGFFKLLIPRAVGGVHGFWRGVEPASKPRASSIDQTLNAIARRLANGVRHCAYARGFGDRAR